MATCPDQPDPPHHRHRDPDPDITGPRARNGGYRASRLPVYDLFPEGASALAADAVGTRFVDAPDFAALARACHANGERVEHHGQLLEALRRALKSVESGTSAIVDVAIHQN
ncbi:MAG: thiamine pyrophosphate-dependent enzyme [Pseudonocardiaceae bacterium]